MDARDYPVPSDLSHRETHSNLAQQSSSDSPIHGPDPDSSVAKTFVSGAYPPHIGCHPNDLFHVKSVPDFGHSSTEPSSTVSDHTFFAARHRLPSPTSLRPSNDSRQVCKLSIIALVGQHFPAHLFQALNCGPDNMVGVAGRGTAMAPVAMARVGCFPGRRSAGHREAQKK